MITPGDLCVPDLPWGLVPTGTNLSSSTHRVSPSVVDDGSGPIRWSTVKRRNEKERNTTAARRISEIFFFVLHVGEIFWIFSHLGCVDLAEKSKRTDSWMVSVGWICAVVKVQVRHSFFHVVTGGGGPTNHEPCPFSPDNIGGNFPMRITISTGVLRST